MARASVVFSGIFFGVSATFSAQKTVGVWHIILVVHIHILDIIVVLLSENALLCSQFCVLCLFPSWFKKKEKHTEEEGTF